MGLQYFKKPVKIQALTATGAKVTAAGLRLFTVSLSRRSGS